MTSYLVRSNICQLYYTLICDTDAVGAQPDDPDIFPVYSPNLKHFPPTWISTCSKDCLRDDGIIMAKMLEKEGVKVKRVHYEGFPHFFHIIYAIPKSQVAIQDMVEGVKFVLN